MRKVQNPGSYLKYHYPNKKSGILVVNFEISNIVSHFDSPNINETKKRLKGYTGVWRVKKLKI